MRLIENILGLIVRDYKNILNNNLIGIYLHGSLAMNCFNPNKSDVDFLVVVKNDFNFDDKRRLADILINLSKKLEFKKFEMSVILESDIKNFKYPTPFVLHYSDYHKEKYERDKKYVCENLTDADLAAHIVVTIKRGRCLVGKPIDKVFKEIPKEYYIDSILKDVKDAREEISDNPVYFILNLCRVLCYLKDGLICSKKEGGEWAVKNVEKNYTHIIKMALSEYENDENKFEWDYDELIAFADFMLNYIERLV